VQANTSGLALFLLAQGLMGKTRLPMNSSVNPKGVLREGKGDTGMKKVPGSGNGPGTFLFGVF
jgi:hypothetical protein